MLLDLRKIGPKREWRDQPGVMGGAQRTFDALGRIIPTGCRNLEALFDLSRLYCVSQQLSLKSGIRNSQHGGYDVAIRLSP